MRLSEVLSRSITEKYMQVEGFLGSQKLGTGKQRKIAIGRVALNFFCKNCHDDRTFCSGEELFCVGVNDHLVSIDCVLKCPCCESLVQMWFLVESEGDISLPSPYVRIQKRSEKLSEMVLLSREKYDDFSELLEKAQRAYRDELGAGAIVYLRKILERITEQVAKAENITIRKQNGNRRPFNQLLEEVDGKCSIIPKEFSANGYKLFSELSEVVHGDSDERMGLEKYIALQRLVIGILENVRKNNEIMDAIGFLGWNDEEVSEK